MASAPTSRHSTDSTRLPRPYIPTSWQRSREAHPDERAKHHTMGWPTRWSDIDDYQPLTGIAFVYLDDFPRLNPRPASRRWRRRVVRKAGRAVRVEPSLQPRNGRRARMFGLKRKGPTRPFTHADNCKILKADPTVQIQCSEVEPGHWRSTSAGPRTSARTPPTVVLGSTAMTRPPSRHARQCEHRVTSDPAAARWRRDGGPLRVSRS